MSSPPGLLDANVLIAVVAQDHQHHRAALRWLGGIDTAALCPTVEGSLFRYLIRLGEPPETPTRVLAALRASGRFEFWPDSLSYADADLGHVIGHRQVTDAYLASLAALHRGRLATFDRGVAQVIPDRVELVPTQ